MLVDGEDLATISGLDPARYQPRGTTPLYDAIGTMIYRLDRRGEAEDVVVVIVTDGLENASREYASGQVHRLIEERKKSGWTFVFLGANQDAYASGERIAVAPGSAANWAASPAGSAAMFGTLSRATARLRAKPSAHRRRDVDGFFEGEERGER